MSELYKIVLTSSLTVLGGVVVFSLTQLIQRFVLDPVNKQAEVIGRIAYCLVYYAPWFGNPGTGKELDMQKASEALRECASQLIAATSAIRCYHLFERRGLIPRR